MRVLKELAYLIWADAFIFGLKNIEKYIIYVLFKKKKKKEAKTYKNIAKEHKTRVAGSQKHVRRIYRMSVRLCLSLS